MIIRRRVKHKFTTMPRAAFEDTRLSYEARGVLGYILVKPDNWRVHVTDLARQAGPKGCGKDRIYRILDELKTAGYMTYSQGKAERGKFAPAEYVISDAPVDMADQPDTENPDTADYPDTVEPDTDCPDTENPDAYKELTSTDYEPETSTKNLSGVSGANDAPGEGAVPTAAPTDVWLPLKISIATLATGKPRTMTAGGKPLGWIGEIVGDVGRIAGDDPDLALTLWDCFEEALTPAEREQYINPRNVGERFGRWSKNGGASTIRAILAQVDGGDA